MSIGKAFGLREHKNCEKVKAGGTHIFFLVKAVPTLQTSQMLRRLGVPSESYCIYKVAW